MQLARYFYKVIVMRKTLLLILMFPSLTFSQIGIGTTNPQAQLDIQSSNQTFPLPTDGI